jgi:SsrA-binding protein
MALILNKKIHLEYKIEEKYVFGIELLGHEVKSVKGKQGSLDGARVIIKNGEMFLMGSYIPPYQKANSTSDDAYRIRKILATRKEILFFHSLGHGNNLQIFPISLFIKGRFIKIECATGVRLKKQDKRNVIKERDMQKKGN